MLKENIALVEDKGEEERIITQANML